MKTIIILLILFNPIVFSAANAGSGFNITFFNDVINFISDITNTNDMQNTANYEDDKLLLDKTIPTALNKTLTVNIPAGNIEVVSHSRSEVIVKIYGNENASSRYDFSAIETSAGAEVSGTEKSKDANSRNVKLRVVVTVPRDYNTDLKTRGGNINVTELNGFVKLKTLGGNIELVRITGDIDGTTQGGNIDISDNKGAVDISTLGGNIQVVNFEGKVDVETKGGNIGLAGRNGSVEANTLGGNISLDYSGDNKGIDLSTKGGSIEMSLPSNIDADAEIKTTAGSITSDFGTPKKKTLSSELITTIGSGGSMLKAKTFAGDIIVTKK